MLAQKQHSNLLAAYRKNDISTDCLSKIIQKSIDAKTHLLEFLGNSDTITVDLPYTQDDYNVSPKLRILIAENPNWSFNFTSCQVTDRTTGHCHKLNKWLRVYHMLTKDDTDAILSYCKQSHTLIISCNPSFLLGSSVTSSGRQLDSSCHYPGGDYASGPVSYSLDHHTIGFFIWDNNTNGITGRQLVYMDLDNNGFVCGRLYGNFTAGMSTHLRKHLYRNYFKSQDFKSTKHFTVNTNNYSGYLDDSHFTAYRKGTTEGIVINLVSPICPDCGDTHSEAEITCCGSNKMTCDCCGERISEDDCYSTDYNTYCEDCYYEKYDNCHACGETYDKDDVYNCDGNWYCSYCAEKKGFYKCHDCGDYTSIDDMTECGGDTYCEKCLPEGSYCDECGQYEETKYLTTTEDAKTYCSDCADNNSFTCTCCELTYSNDQDNGGRCDNDATPDPAPKQTTKPVIADSEYIRTINIRSNDVLTPTESYYTATNILTFSVTNRFKDTGYTITEHSSGMSSSRWYCDTLDQAINRLNQLINDPAELQETIDAVNRSGYKGTN